MAPRRVVVTGVGLIDSVGIGTEADLERHPCGTNGIGTITLFDALRFCLPHCR